MFVKQLKPEDFSFIRKQSELEKHNINVPNKQVEKEFAKLIKHNNIQKLTIDNNNTKLSCSKCQTVVGYIRDRHIKRYGSIENTLKNYLCKECKE